MASRPCCHKTADIYVTVLENPRVIKTVNLERFIEQVIRTVTILAFKYSYNATSNLHNGSKYNLKRNIKSKGFLTMVDNCQHLDTISRDDF
ncbi:uncharacterized protein SOCG_01119 [Schizosaccharomyces octosporus yFS286]|uniref:Uncharacterized protein n=1 Tax=Schizosaccharomyces octosporus (strain yFS286) TaxID=483514 RepID=S9RH39_SCHOY|nr:uncharacterized protein SOCG_01119 [Schizosaccharomyces octosporus yFS286]EPX73369.1 hypothetical protein SOCG_01119 [Schizosaccharomyces octosporus yFS286]